MHDLILERGGSKILKGKLHPETLNINTYVMFSDTGDNLLTGAVFL